MYGININLMHILVIGPLLFGIGYKSPNKYMDFYDYLTGILAILPFMVRIPRSKPSKWDKMSWNSVIHFFAFLPFLGYVAFKRDNAPIFIYNILKILGISIITIHIYLLAEKVINKIK